MDTPPSPATSQSRGLQVLLISAIVAVVLGSTGVAYTILTGPPDTTNQTGTPTNDHESTSTTVKNQADQNSHASAGLASTQLDGVTGKYNGRLDGLSLDFKDIPAKLGVFTKYGATTGYAGQNGELLDQQVALSYSVQISTADFSATIPQSFDLLTSPAKAQASFDENKFIAAKVYDQLLTFSDIPFDHFYDIDTVSYNDEAAISLMVVDSNLFVTLSFRFPKPLGVNDIKPLIDVVITRMKNYAALDASGLARQTKDLAMFRRDELRRTYLTSLNSAISFAAYDQTTKQRNFPPTPGSITRSADGQTQVFAGSLKILNETSAEFSKRVSNIIPPAGPQSGEMTYTYRPKSEGQTYLIYIQLETPGAGWYYGSNDLEQNSLTENYSATEPK